MALIFRSWRGSFRQVEPGQMQPSSRAKDGTSDKAGWEAFDGLLRFFSSILLKLLLHGSPSVGRQQK